MLGEIGKFKGFDVTLSSFLPIHGFKGYRGPYSYLFAYAKALRTQKRYSQLRLAYVQLPDLRTQKVIFMRT